MYTLDDVKNFARSNKPEGVIVDTNLLILFLIGSYNPTMINRSKVLNDSNKIYCADDVLLLERMIKILGKIIITPQILAEVSNLSITKTFKDKELIEYVTKVVDLLKLTEERHKEIESIWGVSFKNIGRFGFTDLTMLELSKQSKIPIMTDDLPFYTHAYNNEAIVIYFDYFKNNKLSQVIN